MRLPFCEPGEPDYVTTSTYNADGELTATTLPEGNQTLLSYDTANPERFAQGLGG